LDKVVCKNFVVEAGGIVNAEVSYVTSQDLKKKEDGKESV